MVEIVEIRRTFVRLMVWPDAGTRTALVNTVVLVPIVNSLVDPAAELE